MGVYEKLGVRTLINAVGNGTAIGGSIMRPEVFAAMEQASHSFVRLPELLDKAGDESQNWPELKQPISHRGQQPA